MSGADCNGDWAGLGLGLCGLWSWCVDNVAYGGDKGVWCVGVCVCTLTIARPYWLAVETLINQQHHFLSHFFSVSFVSLCCLT